MALRKKKDEDLKKIGGLAGFLHRIVMFLTYPFRKPLRFILFLAVIGAIAYCIPVYYYKVEPKNIQDWYRGLFDTVKEQVALPQNLKGTDTLVEVTQQPTAKDVRRQMFLKASGNSPQAVDVLAEKSQDVVDIRDIRRAEEDAEAYKLPVATITKPVETVIQEEKEPEIEEEFDYTRHYGEYSNLDYLNEPITISGEAIVHNANEMTVDGNYVFLYGIYANPKDGRGVRGKVYLKNFVQSEIVSCDILAYTKGEAVATAECYVGDIDINRLMVEKGFADRVSAR
ncbi:MAG: hypothetical protein J6K16_07615 [Alphaproteobacteria bacterium]|nr:hypothetical protein [Alphaproteobacteria bacterium]